MRSLVFDKVFIVIIIIFLQGFILFFRYQYLVYNNENIYTGRIFILIYFIMSIIIIKVICNKYIDAEGDNHEQYNSVSVKKRN